MEHVEYAVVNGAGERDTLTFNIFVNYRCDIVEIYRPSLVKTDITNRITVISTASGGIHFSLPRFATSLSIYDITGRQVGRVMPSASGSGSFAVWPDPLKGGKRVPPGKYFAKVAADGGGAVKPFLMVR